MGAEEDSARSQKAPSREEEVQHDVKMYRESPGYQEDSFLEHLHKVLTAYVEKGITLFMQHLDEDFKWKNKPCYALLDPETSAAWRKMKGKVLPRLPGPPHFVVVTRYKAYAEKQYLEAGGRKDLGRFSECLTVSFRPEESIPPHLGMAYGLKGMKVEKPASKRGSP